MFKTQLESWDPLAKRANRRSHRGRLASLRQRFRPKTTGGLAGCSPWAGKFLGPAVSTGLERSFEFLELATPQSGGRVRWSRVSLSRGVAISSLPWLNAPDAHAKVR